ncbi:ABC transporter, ATP-binding protein [Bacteriovorax sp. DB6_IX]|nr:ABC transporter, ATP-binding protein [Bacteriovorax sp. DB6_IX]
MFQMEAHKISYTYRDSSKEILKNIDFTINQGQKIALIGENGAGKSTLVNILSGKLSDYTGVISKARELKIGLVEQDISQFNELSIADYLWQVREELAKLREQMSSDYELIYEYDEKGGYSFEVKVE